MGNGTGHISDKSIPSEASKQDHEHTINGQPSSGDKASDISSSFGAHFYIFSDADIRGEKP